MVKNSQESNKIAIFPIFNFKVSEELAEEIKNGFHFSNKVILRQIKKDAWFGKLNNTQIKSAEKFLESKKYSWD